jgi:hypothetical protein
VGALAGFELVTDASDPVGALAGFDPKSVGGHSAELANSLRYRATVSRLMPSSRAMRRCDQPWACKVSIDNTLATFN